MKINIKKRVLPNVLIITIFLSGVLVMVGWFFDVDVLKRVVPGFVTMKFITACTFVFTAISLWSIGRLLKNENDALGTIFISASILTIFIIVTTLLLSSLFGFQSGLENIFVEDNARDVFTVNPGQPSLATMVSFLIVALISLVTLASYYKKWKYYVYSGVIITTISLIAVLGYVINEPLLFFSIEDISSAIAIHTAILFCFVGLVLISYSREVKDKNS